jgi:Tol biopolymer transport system component
VLSSKTRIGAYEIISPLGAGGMGEVYRAHDTRLNRDVALKVLPKSFAQDADRLARFAREAHLLAALNHPHIAAIYGLEESGDVRALVLELVDGETLATRLGRGVIPVPEAIEIAKQIAAALDGAHEQGIVHRDLKPANISITRAGVVKVLDFGLAKLTDPAAAGSQSNLSLSPTLTSPVLTTQAGMLLGTAAYMSPEQARGRDADKRADIWAFGCVLYEMLTGKQAFAGETVTDVIAAVVTREPDLAHLPPDTPAGIRWLLARCLQKDPRLRFRDAADAALLLDPTATPGAPVVASSQRRQLPWILGGGAAAIALIALGVAAAGYWRAPTASSPPLIFDIAVNAPLNQRIVISPDGRQIVYAANDGGALALWVRALNDLTARPIPGTAGVDSFSQPFWSPDGRYVAFAAGGKLKRVEPNGGVPETIASIDTQFGGGAWSQSGTLLIASNDHGLRSVPAAGGTFTDVSTRTPDELYHDCPSFLPDGRNFIYLSYGGKPEDRAVYLASLDSAERTRLMTAESCPIYAAGHIMVPRGQTVFARPFDPKTRAFTGDAVPVATNVAAFANGEVPVFASAEGGVMAYRTRSEEASNRRLVWMDRNGRASDPIGPPLRSNAIQLSPDAGSVAYSEPTESSVDDVWVYDLARGVKTRLTTDPAVDHAVVWAADGKRVIFDSHRDTPAAAVLYERVADGSVAERQVLAPEKGVAHSPRAVSADGRHVMFARSVTGSAPWDLWVLPLAGAAKPFPYAASQFDEGGGAISPDSRWAAYVTDETGASQVVVQPFPNPAGGKWQISMNGGAHPRWRRDGRELYYVAPNGDLVAVAVSGENHFTVGRSSVLFRTPFTYVGRSQPLPPYDVRSDGQQFLLALSSGNPNTTPITTVVNWPALLRGKTDAK